jgi:hypothetical protein
LIRINTDGNITATHKSEDVFSMDLIAGPGRGRRKPLSIYGLID